MLAAVNVGAGRERVALGHAVGRVLVDCIAAPRAVPGHANSAVDGYAVRSADSMRERAAEFRIVGTAYAGTPYRGNPLRPFQAVRIMTGASLPDGADTVVMQERACTIDGDHVRLEPPHNPGENVRMAGEDLREGAVMLSGGRWLTPADVGLLASVGVAEVSVHRRLRVGVLSTGNEVRALGASLAPGLVYDSNRHQLCAALQRMGVEVCDLGIARDDPEELAQCLRAAASHTDAIISSGGVSGGAADWVRQVVTELGHIGFWKVAMKPGRPLSFGAIGSATFFGLPGNPVAALVSFCWFVKPVLEKRMGILDRPLIPLVEATAETPLRKRPGRMEFQRGVLQPSPDGGYRVRTTGDQGSGILRSMSLANGLIVLGESLGNLDAGSRVPVLPFAAVF
jgi:molybdopterin molybdotransferase